ncbi:hypothetical protein [Cupriavidus sp. AcVe19-6a]|uniref:hypothetical protein n=1 Tax=Cupriavidus sp. AcVe19-6a TaxID=2821358 RepID=UPI001AEB17BB|nr:hypothetical protein [Cupriavidus sp. AcVe19-6a]MBP0634244.1 hypothetical protein [Cupriavidus sp. AcVe19-6a]
MMPRRKHPRGEKNHAYSRLPHSIQESPAFRSLSYGARSLLLDLIWQHRGGNNGGLIASSKYLGRLGWKSKDTLARALNELLGCRLLVQTREGGRNRVACYALAWEPTAVRIPLSPAFGIRQKSECDAFAENDYPDFRGNIAPVSGVVSNPEIVTAPKIGVVTRFSASRLPRKPGTYTSYQGVSPESTTEEAPATSADRPLGLIAPAAVYLAEHGPALAVSVRPSLSAEATPLCDSADPAEIADAARRAWATTRTSAEIRLVGTRAALERFGPYWQSAKTAPEGAPDQAPSSTCGGTSDPEITAADVRGMIG